MVRPFKWWFAWTPCSWWTATRGKKQMTGEERLATRRQHAEVWAEEIRQECVELRATVLPKSALGKAITYTLNQCRSCAAVSTTARWSCRTT